MAFNLGSIIRSSKPKPPKMTIFGVAGIGKTTFATSAPNPIVIRTEDGLSGIDVPTFPELIKTYDDIMEAIGVLYNEDHDFKTVVIDSLDWLEPIVAMHVCKVNLWPNLEHPGYGKGYIATLESWREIMDGLNALRDERDMAIIMTAHSQIAKFDAPDTESYSRYVLKLHRLVAALVLEGSDVVGFANYRTSIVKADAGFGKKNSRGVGAGERQLHLEERPGYIAKQRYNCPETIPLDWESFAEGIPYYNQKSTSTLKSQLPSDVAEAA